ncbi:MAG: hypothetical protein AAGA54_11960 [Myxococcota bacterium]
MSSRSRSDLGSHPRGSSALFWSVLAVVSALALGQALGAALSLSYGLTAATLFGLMLGSVGALRHLSGKTREDLLGVSRRDVAFAASFSIVLSLGFCALL